MLEGLAYQFIPFFFTLAVAYGALQVSGLFKNKAVNMLIAIVLALFAASTQGLVEFIYTLLYPATVLFIIFFFIGFVYKFFKERKETDYTLMVVVLGLLLLLMAAGVAGNPVVPIGSIMSENLVVLLGLVFIVAMFYASYKQMGKKGQ